MSHIDMAKYDHLFEGFPFGDQKRPDTTNQNKTAFFVRKAAPAWNQWLGEDQPDHQLHAQVPIAELKPHALKQFDHDDPKIQELVPHIKANGIQNPINVLHYGQDDMFVSDGNHRLQAAEMAGMTHVPVNVYNGKSDAGRSKSNRALFDDDIAASGFYRKSFFVRKSTTQMMKPSELFPYARKLDPNSDRYKSLKQNIIDYGYHPEWPDNPPVSFVDGPKCKVLDNGSHRVHILHELGQDDPIPVKTAWFVRTTARDEDQPDYQAQMKAHQQGFNSHLPFKYLTEENSLPSYDHSAEYPPTPNADPNRWDHWLGVEHPTQKLWQVPISEVKPYRGHGLLRDNNNLVEDVKKNGIQNPISMAMISQNIKDPATGEYSRKVAPFFGDGHHRLDAAENAGLTHVPVMMFNGLNSTGGDAFQDACDGHTQTSWANKPSTPKPREAEELGGPAPISWPPPKLGFFVRQAMPALPEGGSAFRGMTIEHKSGQWPADVVDRVQNGQATPEDILPNINSDSVGEWWSHPDYGGKGLASDHAYLTDEEHMGHPDNYGGNYSRLPVMLEAEGPTGWDPKAQFKYNDPKMVNEVPSVVPAGSSMKLKKIHYRSVDDDQNWGDWHSIDMAGRNHHVNVGEHDNVYDSYSPVPKQAWFVREAAPTLQRTHLNPDEEMPHVPHPDYNFKFTPYDEKTADPSLVKSDVISAYHKDAPHWPVGTLKLQPHEDGDNTPRGLVHWVGVDQDHTGKGLARSMMDFAEKNGQTPVHDDWNTDRVSDDGAEFIDRNRRWPMLKSKPMFAKKAFFVRSKTFDNTNGSLTFNYTPSETFYTPGSKFPQSTKHRVDAYHNGEHAGYMELNEGRRGGEPHGLIDMVSVNPQHRGKGIARAIGQHFENEVGITPVHSDILTGAGYEFKTQTPEWPSWSSSDGKVRQGIPKKQPVEPYEQMSMFGKKAWFVRGAWIDPEQIHQQKTDALWSPEEASRRSAASPFHPKSPRFMNDPLWEEGHPDMVPGLPHELGAGTPAQLHPDQPLISSQANHMTDFRKLEGIRANGGPDNYGGVHVMRHQDGSHVVIDGHHRILADRLDGRTTPVTMHTPDELKPEVFKQYYSDPASLTPGASNLKAYQDHYNKQAFFVRQAVIND